MSIKRIFIVISAIFAASTVFADNSSVTSKKYVDDLMSGYQGKLPGSGANTLMIYDDEAGIGEKSIEATLVSNATGVPTVGAVKTGLDGKQDTITGTAGYVMTGTGYDGSVGEKPIYGTSSRYNSALVTAETVNTGVINAVNSSLIRVNEQGVQSDSGTLWQIADDLTALSVCSNYATATGTGVQDGTPTPTNPVMPVFYQQGDMILRAVGTYADSYDATTNKITRRVGVKMLNGTENWELSPYYSGVYPTFWNVGLIKDNADVVSGEPAVVSCPYLAAAKKSAATTTPIDNTISIGSKAHSPHTLWIRTSAYDNVTDFKQWLAVQYAAGTPVVVYYPLATPVEETMPPRCK